MYYKFRIDSIRDRRIEQITMTILPESIDEDIKNSKGSDEE